MNHVTDELELFALGALPPADIARIGQHLAGCAECRVASSALAEVVGALPETVEPRDVPPGLRSRILESARADARANSPASPVRPQALSRIALLRGRPPRLVLAGLLIAVVVLAAIDVREYRELNAAASERARMTAIVERLGQSGSSWYMSGTDEWRGSGGTFVVSQSEGKAAVLFHDLKPLPADKVYALWLVSPDNRWVRGANVLPDGGQLQLVDVNTPVQGFDRCYVTLDNPEGRREGPVVMQSRIAPAP